MSKVTWVINLELDAPREDVAAALHESLEGIDRDFHDNIEPGLVKSVSLTGDDLKAEIAAEVVESMQDLIAEGATFDEIEFLVDRAFAGPGRTEYDLNDPKVSEGLARLLKDLGISPEGF